MFKTSVIGWSRQVNNSYSTFITFLSRAICKSRLFMFQCSARTEWGAYLHFILVLWGTPNSYYEFTVSDPKAHLSDSKHCLFRT